MDRGSNPNTNQRRSRPYHGVIGAAPENMNGLALKPILDFHFGMVGHFLPGTLSTGELTPESPRLRLKECNSQ